jgi:hypothetical protein
MTGNGLTNYKIEELQKQVTSLQATSNIILTNHLPHLKEDIISLKTQVKLATAINIGAIILGLVASRMIR